MKPKPVAGKYTGAIQPDTSYLCVSDNNILKVESITRPKDAWMVNLRYTHSLTKKGSAVSIEVDTFTKDLKSGKFSKI